MSMTRTLGGVAVLVLLAGTSQGQKEVRQAPTQAAAPAVPTRPAVLVVHPFPPPAPPVVDPRTRAWEQVRTHVEARPHSLPPPQGTFLPCGGKGTSGASPVL